MDDARGSGVRSLMQLPGVQRNLTTVVVVGPQSALRNIVHSTSQSKSPPPANRTVVASRPEVRRTWPMRSSRTPAGTYFVAGMGPMVQRCTRTEVQGPHTVCLLWYTRLSRPKLQDSSLKTHDSGRLSAQDSRTPRSTSGAGTH